MSPGKVFDPFRIEFPAAAVGSLELHHVDFDADGFDLGVKLDQIEAAFIGSKLFHQVASVIQRVAKLGKPARSLRREILT